MQDFKADQSWWYWTVIAHVCGYAYSSLEMILLLHSSCTVINDQRASADQNKDSNGGCEGIVISVYSQLIEPCNKQVCLACLIVVQREWATACQQINNIEVIEIGHKCGDGCRCCHKDHVWQCNRSKFLDRTSSVYQAPG